MVGTLGPLVQGPNPRMRMRVKLTAMFVVAFLIGAVTIFSSLFLLGSLFQVAEMSLDLRRILAGGSLLVFASLDLWARGARAFCPLGLKRQTPQRLSRRHSMYVVASIWGFDTGLAITTFRVAAATWGAVVLTFLGLAGWQTGIAYGIAFTLPLTFLMWNHRAGQQSNRPGDGGLSKLAAQSTVWQLNSAVLLVLGGMMLFVESVVA